jgi:protein-S-isoprenylcysteine O-methyltransferase
MLAAFMIIEGRLRQGEDAQSLHAGAADKGTTAAVGATFGLALAGGPVAALSRPGRLPAYLGWSGVAIMATGLALRVTAARTLGASYTRTLRTQTSQTVVQDGPYRYVRHPGYAGTLAMWLGYGLALTSAPAVLVTTVPNLIAYLRRIDAEEKLLADSLGDAYRDYQQRSARLVPGAY